MRLLVDTHALLWVAFEPQKLTKPAATALHSPANDLILSTASIWEMAIKINRGKLTIQGGLSPFLAASSAKLRLQVLPILPQHALVVETLTRHHDDPFDRILVAQCMAEGIGMVSGDSALDPYGITRIW